MYFSIKYEFTFKQAVESVGKQHKQSEVKVTEAKLRVEDHNSSSYKKSNASYYEKPITEGRMRSQEQKRFAVHENLSKSTQMAHPPKPTNPFEDDDNIEYDESKNPFANENAVENKQSNPFGEYDSN